MFCRTPRRRLRNWCRVVTLLLGCVLVWPVCAQQRDAKTLLDSVFADWKHRQSVMKSARYVLTGAMEYKEKDLPPGGPTRPRKSVILLDLVKNRYRLEEAEEVIYADAKNFEYRRRISTSAYDGKALQSLSHRKENRIDPKDDDVDLSIGKGNLGPGAQFRTEMWPVFFAHGIVPTVHSPPLVDKLPLSHDPDNFDVSGKQLLRGQECLLVRTDPLPGVWPISDEMWINLKQRSAIHRYITFRGEDPWSRLEIFWKNTPYGWWIDHWSETWSDHGRVRHICRLRVDAFEANPEVSDSDFLLPAEPGMKVTVGEYPSPGNGLDPSKAANKTYLISPSGSWDELSSKGFTTLEGEELPPEGRRRWIAWTIGGGIATGALIIYLLRRRRRKQNAIVAPDGIA
jgi:hypothetical protein